MKEIVGVSLSRFHDSEDQFEFLIAYADGREIGHEVSRRAALAIQEELNRNLDLKTPPPSSLVRATGTQEFTLRAMAQNYSGGHSWDQLDGEVCLKAADEIRRLRLELAATIREGISAVADARQTAPPQPREVGE